MTKTYQYFCKFKKIYLKKALDVGAMRALRARTKAPPFLRLKSPVLPHLQGVKASHLLVLYGGWENLEQLKGLLSPSAKISVLVRLL